MKKPWVYMICHKVGGWEKQRTVEEAVRKDAGKGARFIVLSIIRDPIGLKQSRIVNREKFMYTILFNRVTYVVLPKIKINQHEALQKIIYEYAQQQVKNIIAFFSPATKAVGMRESTLKKCFEDLAK